MSWQRRQVTHTSEQEGTGDQAQLMSKRGGQVVQMRSKRWYQQCSSEGAHPATWESGTEAPEGSIRGRGTQGRDRWQKRRSKLDQHREFTTLLHCWFSPPPSSPPPHLGSSDKHTGFTMLPTALSDMIYIHYAIGQWWARGHRSRVNGVAGAQHEGWKSVVWPFLARYSGVNALGQWWAQEHLSKCNRHAERQCESSRSLS